MKQIYSMIFCALLWFFGASAALFPAPLDAVAFGGAVDARQRLLLAAESYLGTPYRYGGVDSRGLDCSGLVFACFRDAFNLEVPRTSGDLFAWTERVALSDLSPGDLVFFITSGSGISHVGIYAGNGRFIHAPSEGSVTGVTYSRLDEEYWNRSFAGAGRIFPLAAAVAEETPAATGSAVATADGAAAGSVTAAAAAPPIAAWAESSGFMTGIAFSAALGGFVDGSVFRGLGIQLKVGYKGIFGSGLQAALEFRPEWDRFLNVYRLPLTLSLGTDTLQVFAGPALTLGDARVNTENPRAYTPGPVWLGEVGVSAALKPFTVAGGALSVFAEIAWQPYFSSAEFDLLKDLAANLRISAGARFLWLP